MPSKPWKTPDTFQSGGDRKLFSTFEGLITYVRKIMRANEFRRESWKKSFAGSELEIDEAVDFKNERLALVIVEIEQVRNLVKDDPNRESHEQIFCQTIAIGMAINSAALSWTFTAAEYGIAQEDGRRKAKDKNVKDWGDLKWQAEVALSAVEGDPLYANATKTAKYKAAGESMDPPVKSRAFQQYLKGTPPRRGSK